jgi:hypothetical protein
VLCQAAPFCRLFLVVSEVLWQLKPRVFWEISILVRKHILVK